LRQLQLAEEFRFVIGNCRARNLGLLQARARFDGVELIRKRARQPLVDRVGGGRLAFLLGVTSEKIERRPGGRVPRVFAQMLAQEIDRVPPVVKIFLKRDLPVIESGLRIVGKIFVRSLI
jgi:hypothetical protein